MAVVIAAAATGITTTVSPRAALAATNDLSASDNATFTVADNGVLHVVDDEQITNTKPGFAGGYYYFNVIAVPVVAGAANVTATLDGAAQSVSIDTPNRAFATAHINLNPVLRSLQTRHLVLTYDILPTDPRARSFVQDNPAFVSFPAFAPGDPDRTSVTVVVPQHFDVAVANETMGQADTGDTVTYSETSIADPGNWTALVSAEDDRLLTLRNVKVSRHNVLVRAWPNDPGWATFVGTQLRRGVPVLEKLVGSPLPATADLMVTETATPYAYGYAGWYASETNTIDIGNELDPVVVLHETSHEWFNNDHFAERWMNEGLAQELSTRAVAAEGSKLQQPTRPDLHSDVAVQLLDWTQPDPQDPNADRKEQWGYNAAFYVLRSIEQEIGPTHMRAALQTALSRHEAYGVLPGRPDPLVSAVDWKHLLDDFDVVGGSHRADALFQKYVLGVSTGALVPAHAALRRSYDAIARQAGQWGVPLAMRQTIEQWDDDNTAAVEHTTKSILDLRDRLDRELGAVHLSLPVSLRDAYRRADFARIGAVLAQLGRYEPTVAALVRAEHTVHGNHSILTRVGLLGAHADHDLAAAEAALRRGDSPAAAHDADAATKAVHRAARRALVGIGALLGIVLVLLGVRWLRRRRRRRRWSVPLTAPAPAEAAAADPPVLAGAGAGAGAGVSESQ